jgi:hypothetical protein
MIAHGSKPDQPQICDNPESGLLSRRPEPVN